METQDKRLFGIILAVGVLLTIPFAAMKLTDGVNWSMFDFILAGTLLLGSGLACELVFRNVKKTQHRIAIVAGLLLVLLLVWVELAVGLFGTPLAGS